LSLYESGTSNPSGWGEYQKLTGEEYFRNMLNGPGDTFGSFSEKIDLMFRFINAVCEGIKPEAFRTSLFKDLTSSDKRDLQLAAWFLKIVDSEPLTGRVIYRIRDMIEKSMLKYTGEELALMAGVFELHIFYNVVDSNYTVPVGEFTKYCTKISGSRFRLVYQSMDDGSVLINDDLLRKIIREASVSFIKFQMEIIDRDVAVDIFGNFESSFQSLAKKAQNIKIETEMGPIDVQSFPPCIKHYISDIRNGINLPHMGRFAMVSFLNKVGMKQEDIMSVFGTVPDFSARITEYQVKHIMGLISGIKYTPPKCETLRSNHLCYMGDDPLCADERVKHPLTYYTIKKKRMPKKA
jgi:DNA primase large subunit